MTGVGVVDEVKGRATVFCSTSGVWGVFGGSGWNEDALCGGVAKDKGHVDIFGGDVGVGNPPPVDHRQHLGRNDKAERMQAVAFDGGDGPEQGGQHGGPTAGAHCQTAAGEARRGVIAIPGEVGDEGGLHDFTEVRYTFLDTRAEYCAARMPRCGERDARSYDSCDRWLRQEGHCCLRRCFCGSLRTISDSPCGSGSGCQCVVSPRAMAPDTANKLARAGWACNPALLAAGTLGFAYGVYGLAVIACCAPIIGYVLYVDVGRVQNLFGLTAT